MTEPIARQRVSDDFIVLVMTSVHAVIIGIVWLIMGRPLAG